MAGPKMQERPPANHGIKWVERLHDWIDSNDDQNCLNRFVKWCSVRYHMTKWQAFVVSFFIIMAFMVAAPALALLTCDLLCVGYGVMTIRTAASKRKWNELWHWLVYCIVFAVISCFDFLIKKTTLYAPAKLILMAYMGLPTLQGARALCQQWIDPIMYQGQYDCGNVMEKAHPRLLKWLEIDPVLMATMIDADCRQYVNQKKKAWRAKLFRSNAGAGPWAN